MSTDLATTDPIAVLTQAMQHAIADVSAPTFVDADPAIRASQKPEFGDFQANCAMGLAKRTQRKPRDLAQELVDAADVSAIAEPLEVAGPGFINIRLRTDALASMVDAMDDGDLGVVPRDGVALDRDRHVRGERGEADARRPPAVDDHR